MSPGPAVKHTFVLLLTSADVESLISDRGDDGYKDKAKLLEHDAFAGLELNVGFDITSAWFNVLTDVTIGGGRARLESLLLRDAQRARHRVVVVIQTLLADARILVECPVTPEPVVRSAHAGVLRRQPRVHGSYGWWLSAACA